ncbi:MAG: phytanoyl-CoA dioxygenase family protein [Mycobacterium sp.]|nr:phytanoyl-CoA dioxygenase family protein [Mycobacterium sp.]
MGFDVSSLRAGPGFVAIPELVRAGELSGIADAYDSITAAGAATVCPALHWMRPGQHAIDALLPDSLQSRVRDHVEAVTGTAANKVSLSCRVFLKPAGAAMTQPHQDHAYHRSPADRVTVWIALDDSHLRNGALFYHPDTHRDGLLAHRIADTDLTGNTLTVATPARTPRVAVPLAAGGAVLHHRDVVHGAYPNTTAVPRRGLVVVCDLPPDPM